jgi:hypothetical protein
MAAVLSARPARHRPVAAAGFPRRRWRQRLLGLALLASGAGMVPWLTYLAITLPARTSVPHWSAAWVGLDVMEAIGLVATGWLVRRGDAHRCLVAAATAMLLVVDAWLDISTAGSGLTGAVAMAACAELPMAALCSVVAYRAVRDSSRPPGLDSTGTEPGRHQGSAEPVTISDRGLSGGGRDDQRREARDALVAHPGFRERHRVARLPSPGAPQVGPAARHRP